MNIDRTRRRFVAAAAAFIIAVSGISRPLGGLAAESETAVPESVLAEMESDYYTFSESTSQLPTFGEYYDLHCNDSRPEKCVTLSGGDFRASGGDITVGDYTADGVTKENSLVWNEDAGSVSCLMEVPETGIYCLDVTYCALSTKMADIEFSLAIDGDIPFDSASRLTLPAVWENEAPVSADSKGNQIRPTQVRREMWQSRLVGDPDGLFSQPLFFFLEKGSRTLTLSAERAGFVLAEISFTQKEGLSSYSESPAAVDNTPSALIRIEGENAAFKSAATLSPTYDNTNYLVSPSDPCKVVYNTIGAGSWNISGQSVTWSVPEGTLPADGWYRLGIKARQNKMRGFSSNRRIYIDGNVPYSELDCVSFPYGRDWRITSPETQDGADVYIFLTRDTAHAITLEAVPGAIGEPLRRLDATVAELNGYYRRILMITGPTPDKYTDYYVHEKIPELVSELSRISSELDGIRRDIEEISGSKGSEAAVIEQMTVILGKCIEKPIMIPSYLARIKESLTSLSAWAREYREQPLEVDFIELATADRDFSSCKKKLGKSIAFGLKAFVGSFFEDYTTLSDAEGKEAIEVWVSLGRDRAQIVRELTESDFTSQFGVPVSVKLVSGGVVEAALAGKEPDVALFLGGEFPVNLAARGLLADVSGMEDFESVRERFQANAMTHYTYGGGVYGVPISQSFPMMFCRTDILSELGFTHPPETWDELRDMLPALQRNYMSVGLVLPGANISPATEAGHTFAMLLLQSGLGYYDSDSTSSSFGETEAVRAFGQWTDFYTDYGFEQTYDAFSRFRTGEYPIVISSYTFANQLSAAAPEIKGMWEFFPVPGTLREDGSVSHAANSTGSGAVIFESCKNKDAAWEYVKWFTSAEVQTRFSAQSEGILGTFGRFDTANIEALGNLSWSGSELERLRAQQSELCEIPITPASYAVTRNIMNAFREVINTHSDPRDTLLRYTLDINEEIKRKASQLKDK